MVAGLASLFPLLFACTGGKPGAASDCILQSVYVDADGDGYGAGGAVQACTDATGYAAQGGDCDDGQVSVHPGAAEICDGLDNDCDTVVDPSGAVDVLTCTRDADGDGYGDDGMFYKACACGDGYVQTGGDCNDGDASVSPAAVEIWYDGVDQDCAGDVDDDVDGDGHAWDGAGGDDCDDADPGVNPDAEDVCGSGVDEDCDGLEPDCGWRGMVDVDSSNGELWGDRDDMAGFAFDYAGDGNGNGIPEVITGRYDQDRLAEDARREFVLFEVAGGTGEARDGDLDSAVVATFSQPSDRPEVVGMQGENIRGFGTGFDLNGDGYYDYVLGTTGVSNLINDLSHMNLVYGPIVGDYDLKDSQSIWMESQSDQIGSQVAILGEADGDGVAANMWLVASNRLANAGEASSTPWIRVYDQTAFETGNPFVASIVSPSVEEWSSSCGGRLDAGDVDGDGVRDLLFGCTQYANGLDREAGAWTLLALGPLSGEIDPFDADLVINESTVAPPGDFIADVSYHHLLELQPQQPDIGLARVVIAGPLDPTATHNNGGTVRFFDWSGPGWLDAASDFSARIDGPEDCKAGAGGLSWGGDLDVDGQPELVVRSAACGASIPDEDLLEPVFLIEPPVSGAMELLDAETIFYSGLTQESNLGNDSLSRYSLDGDATTDLLLSEPDWDPHDSHVVEDGRFLFFQGSPTGF